MAALAADLNIHAEGNYRTSAYSANATDTYYQGSVVYIDAAGGVQVTAAAGDRCVGISPTRQVITAIGQEVAVITEGLIWIPVPTGLTAAQEGSYLVNDGVVDTDNPVDFVTYEGVTGADNDIILGVVDRVTATEARIWISRSITGQLYVSTGGFGWGG